MRTRIAFPIIVVASLLASKLLAGEPAQSGSSAECRSPEALAFSKGIKDLLSRSEQAGKNQQQPPRRPPQEPLLDLPKEPAQDLPREPPQDLRLELWSKDTTFRKWVASPKSTLADVDRYLRCTPTASPTEVELATLSLQCLDFRAYLSYLNGLSLAAKNDAVGWGLYYAIAPGFLSWSTHLAAKYTDAKAKSTLKGVARSANANTTVQKMISEILDGTAKKAIAMRPIKPILTCGARAGK